jgi:hypothetical protein
LYFKDCKRDGEIVFARQLNSNQIKMIMNRKASHNITYTQAGVSCLVGQESGKFEVQFFVGSSVFKIPSFVLLRTFGGHYF